ncbi:MAG: GNAT family N-acetyltransferase [Firmicutes bacterium]|nr:GNAT family N-acetyltransferase [Bacillota bacterium]
MDRVTCEKQLGSLITAALRRRPSTNGRMSPASYRLAIEEGRLLYAEKDGMLLVSEKRPGYELLRFWAPAGMEEETAGFVAENSSGLAVFEAVFKPDGSPKGLAAAADALEKLGFEKKVVRRRMSGPIDPQSFAPVDIQRPSEEDLAQVSSMLLETYDNYTGCVPVISELRLLAKNGLFILKSGEEITAMVHYLPDSRVFDATHLIVRPALRGQGIAGRLMAAAMKETKTGVLRLWVNDGNTSALRLYDRLHLEYDGMLSLVYERN